MRKTWVPCINNHVSLKCWLKIQPSRHFCPGPSLKVAIMCSLSKTPISGQIRIYYVQHYQAEPQLLHSDSHLMALFEYLLDWCITYVLPVAKDLGFVSLGHIQPYVHRPPYQQGLDIVCHSSLWAELTANNSTHSWVEAEVSQISLLVIPFKYYLSHGSY